MVDKRSRCRRLCDLPTLFERRATTGGSRMDRSCFSTWMVRFDVGFIWRDRDRLRYPLNVYPAENFYDIDDACDFCIEMTCRVAALLFLLYRCRRLLFGGEGKHEYLSWREDVCLYYIVDIAGYYTQRWYRVATTQQVAPIPPTWAPSIRGCTLCRPQIDEWDASHLAVLMTNSATLATLLSKDVVWVQRCGCRRQTRRVDDHSARRSVEPGSTADKSDRTLAQYKEALRSVTRISQVPAGTTSGSGHDMPSQRLFGREARYNRDGCWEEQKRARAKENLHSLSQMCQDIQLSCRACGMNGRTNPCQSDDRVVDTYMIRSGMGWRSYFRTASLIHVEGQYMLKKACRDRPYQRHLWWTPTPCFQ